jgi:hypothetical protein
MRRQNREPHNSKIMTAAPETKTTISKTNLFIPWFLPIASACGLAVMGPAR